MNWEMKNKNLVVGAGISGATIANLLTNNNEQVLIIDKKPHIAGACFDYKDKNNITILPTLLSKLSLLLFLSMMLFLLIQGIAFVVPLFLFCLIFLVSFVNIIR